MLLAVYSPDRQSAQMDSHGHTCGFTLLELLVVIATVAIITTLSVSGFSALLENIRMDNGVNNLLHSFHLARQKSHLNGFDVTVCKSRDGHQCHNSAEWHDGWVVFGNRDSDDPPDIDPGEPVFSTTPALRNLHISANRQAFHIRPFGRRSTNGSFIYCPGKSSSRSRSVIVSYTGKPRSVIRNKPRNKNTQCSQTT
jgi:type IV fimbrial biogenesis protein FimT